MKSKNFFLLSIIVVFSLLLTTSCDNTSKFVKDQMIFNKGVGLYNSSLAHNRVEAIECFSKVKDKKSMEYIKKSLSDKDAIVRVAAINTLTRIEQINALKYLLDMLSEKDTRVLEAAKHNLILLKGQIIPVFNKYGYINDVNIIKAMGIIADKSFITVLGDIVVKSKFLYLKKEAIIALSKIDDPIAQEYVYLALKDPNPQVVINAINSLKKDGNFRLVQLMGPLLMSDNLKIKQAVVNALTENNNDEAVPILINSLIDPNSDNMLNESIRKSLSSLVTKRTLPLLINVLNGDTKIQAKYAVLMSAIDSQATDWPDQVILTAVRSDMPEIKTAAMAGLNRDKSDISLKELLNGIRSSDTSTRINAIVTLSKNPKANEYKEKFLELLKDSNFEVRLTTIKSLSNIKRDWVFATLKQLLESQYNENISVAAAESLGSFQNTPEVANLLSKALRDNRYSVASASSKALVSMGGAKAKFILINNLGDKSVNIRLLSIRALETLGDYSAIGALQRLTSDSVPEIRHAAQKAITSIEKRKAIRDNMLFKPVR